MTENSNLKRRVRSRAAKTGESYTAALRQIRPIRARDDTDPTPRLTLAVAQSEIWENPAEADDLRKSGEEVRRLMREAHDAGARLLHLTEGAMCSPHKRALSTGAAGEVGPSDWDLFRWDVLHAELAAVCRLAGGLKIWVVLGSVHRLSPPSRPHNSLYVISDQGRLVTRYDERYLSQTKIAFMYSLGSEPITFEVDGFRFGCALGMDGHFQEVFAEYESLDVDCVLFSTKGGFDSDGPVIAKEAQGFAAANSYPVSFSVPASYSSAAAAGLIDGGGEWSARCSPDGRSGFVVADLEPHRDDPSRAWRRRARDNARDSVVVHDSRSTDRWSY